MTRYARIVSTSRDVPGRVTTHAEFEPLVAKPIDQWLVEKVAVGERHVMTDELSTSDLVVPACQQGLERAGLEPPDLDLIVVATDTPDCVSPATASVVQAKLGMTEFGPGFFALAAEDAVRNAGSIGRPNFYVMRASWTRTTSPLRPVKSASLF